MIPLPVDGRAQGMPVKVGDTIALQNAENGFILYACYETYHDCMTFNAGINPRDNFILINGSYPGWHYPDKYETKWKIMSMDGKPEGSDLLQIDRVFLQNRFPTDGDKYSETYLDVCGAGKCSSHTLTGWSAYTFYNKLGRGSLEEITTVWNFSALPTPVGGGGVGGGGGGGSH